MKVVDLIKQLNDLEYDENTELSFICYDSSVGVYNMIARPCRDVISDGPCKIYDMVSIKLKFERIDDLKPPVIDRMEVDEFLSKVKFYFENFKNLINEYTEYFKENE